jgi:hypothetical protein
MWEYLKERWWGQLICAGFFFGIATLVYWYIDKQESESAYVHIHWLLAFIYSISGKWGCVAVFALPGALFAFMGIWNGIVAFRSQNED